MYNGRRLVKLQPAQKAIGRQSVLLVHSDFSVIRHRLATTSSIAVVSVRTSSVFITNGGMV